MWQYLPEWIPSWVRTLTPVDIWDLEDKLLEFGKYSLPMDGMSRPCAICGKNAFILLKEYQGVTIKPKRCLGCVLKFPPEGITTQYNDFIRLRPWLKSLERYHQWGLIGQTNSQDVWTCLHCSTTLRSPKLGVPASRGCVRGVDFRPRKTFWAHIRISHVQCPLCDERAILVRAPRLLESRPSSKFFPWTCRECFG
jgi:hypothetical protein